MLESKHVGPKRKAITGESYFFISHAWIQNFSVAGNDWRGGLAQAIVDSTPLHLRSTTYVWFDGFSINQHDTRLAFFFEPLRNVIKEVSFYF